MSFPAEASHHPRIDTVRLTHPHPFLPLACLGLPSYADLFPSLRQAITQQSLRCLFACLFTGKILVHCAVGVSRSATLVLAYLMLYHHFTLVEAIKKVKDHRGIIPNRGFLRQLLALDRRLRQGLEA